MGNKIKITTSDNNHCANTYLIADQTRSTKDVHFFLMLLSATCLSNVFYNYVLSRPLVRLVYLLAV